MKLTDPCELLRYIPQETYENYLALCKRLKAGPRSKFPEQDAGPIYVEPSLLVSTASSGQIAGVADLTDRAPWKVIEGKAYKMGDYVDTDAVRTSHSSLPASSF